MKVNRKSTRPTALLVCAAAALAIGCAGALAEDKEAPPVDPDTLLAELGGLAKEDKKLDDKLAQLKTERAALGPRVDNLKHQQQNLDQRWQEGEAYCTGTFEEPEYSRRKARCAAMEKEMRGEQGRLDGQREAIKADWQRIDNERSKASARKEAIRARGAKIQSLLAGLVRFRDRGEHCLSLPLEAMHHCMQEIWDGAGPRPGAAAGGDPNVVVVPNSDGRRRTAEQAIEEYRNSGPANPAPPRPTQKEPPPPAN